MAESEEELKSLLMRVKEDSEEHGLKLSIKNKTKIMASDTIISSFPVLENRTGKKGSSDRLDFLGSKIAVDSNRSHEIQRLLLFGRKAMTNLDSTFKSREITMPTKVYLIKAMVFPVIM